MRTARSDAMMGTLPSYYWGEPLLERIVQAWANEIDRIDGTLDRLKTEMAPVDATDDVAPLLSLWEATLGLPIRPAGLTTPQRQAKLDTALHTLDSHTAADVLATLEQAAGAPVTVQRDTPDPLTDTLVLTFLPGSSAALQVEIAARRLWPAHRALLIKFADGFVLDVSRLDVDSF